MHSLKNMYAYVHVFVVGCVRVEYRAEGALVLRYVPQVQHVSASARHVPSVGVHFAAQAQLILRVALSCTVLLYWATCF